MTPPFQHQPPSKDTGNGTSGSGLTTIVQRRVFLGKVMDILEDRILPKKKRPLPTSPRLSLGLSSSSLSSRGYHWNVSDTSLQPRPPTYPPLIPTSSTYVCDASRSTVAARIASCLRARSYIFIKLLLLENMTFIFLYHKKVKIPCLRIKIKK